MRTITLFILLALSTFHIRGDDVKSLTLRLQTPTPGYAIELQRLDKTKEGTAALLRVIPPPGDAILPMVIDEATVTVVVEDDLEAPTIHVLNRPWGWGDEVTVDSEQAYLEKIGDATPIDFKSDSE